jgi:hypothetical protein
MGSQHARLSQCMQYLITSKVGYPELYVRPMIHGSDCLSQLPILRIFRKTKMRKMDRRFETHAEQIKALAPCTDARTASHANAGPYVHACAHVLNYILPPFIKKAYF